jgi:hypothetical protein
MLFTASAGADSAQINNSFSIEGGEEIQFNTQRKEKRMNTRNIRIIATIFITTLLVVFVSACDKKEEKLSFASEYQAVFLDNGQVFFGKLENGGADHPKLTEVYYIGQQASPDGKGVANILLKRGNEWHGPDSMYLTRNHIVMIEPVSSTSRVAELIKELKAKQPENK